MTPINIILEAQFKDLLNWSIAKLGEKQYYVQIRGPGYWGTGNGETPEAAIKKAYDEAERMKNERLKAGTY